MCLQLSGAKNRMTKIKRDREEDRFEFPVLCYEKKTTVPETCDCVQSRDQIMDQ